MKDRWSQLSMSEKSDLMSLYIRNGISSLEEIKKHYNSYQDGGRISFQQWKAMMKSKYPDIEMDNNKAGYNYEEYFNNHYDDAIKQLNNLQHFPDTYKLPNHPTFSNESIYSRGPIIGGSWINDSTFTPSVINKQYYPNIYKEDRNYTEREIYNSFATGGQMNTDGPDEPPEEISYKRQLLPVNIYNDDAQAWLQDWLSNRKTQLRDNYLASRSPFRKVKDWFIGNKHYGIENNVLAAQLEGMNRMSQIISDNPEEVYAEGNPDYSVYNDSYIDWLTGHTHGETFHKSDKIYYNPIEEITTIEYDDRDPREEDISTNNIIINKTLEDIPMSTRIHENTHALADYYNDKNRLSPQEKIIYNKYAHYLNEKDESLLHPSEIYSRIMSLRYNTGLKPTDKVDKKWLENNEKFIKDLHLDFRKDKLIDLLNEVAYNYNPEVLKLS